MIFLKYINLLIQDDNTINRNIESKVLETLENDVISKLIAKKSVLGLHF